MPKFYAHYCNNGTLRITDSIRPVGGQVFQVRGKRDARIIAESFGALCWNF